MADLNSWSFTLGACVEVLVTETNELMSIFFQDSETQQIFKSYPEFICLDATYKLLEFPVYMMLIEDGNGQSEIAAAILLI